MITDVARALLLDDGDHALQPVLNAVAEAVGDGHALFPFFSRSPDVWAGNMIMGIGRTREGMAGTAMLREHRQALAAELAAGGVDVVASSAADVGDDADLFAIRPSPLNTDLEDAITVVVRLGEMLWRRWVDRQG